jgi:hypothetical protein
LRRDRRRHPERLGKHGHRQPRAGEISRIGVVEDQVAVRRTVPGETQDHRVVGVRSFQGADNGIPYLGKRRLLIDEEADGEAGYRVREQRP